MELGRRGFLAGLGVLIASSALPSIAECALPLGPGEWVYDEPLGCFRNPALTADLLRRNGIALTAPPLRPSGAHIRPPGTHEWGIWSPVSGPLLDMPPQFRSAYAPSGTPELAARLMRKARPLADRLCYLDLRAAIPADFGRTKMLALYGWYR